MLELGKGDLREGSGNGKWEWITRSKSETEPKPISVPAGAESNGDHLIVWDDGDRVRVDDHHYRVLAFLGKYITPAKSESGKCHHCKTFS